MELWMDTSATCHICADKTIFSSYTLTNSEKLFMENSPSLKMKDNAKYYLKMTWARNLS